MDHKIAIVFPVINKVELTTAAINSIKTKHEKLVVIIDNGSTDSTVGWANQGGAHMVDKVIENGENRGLTVAWNQGIAYARENGCDLVILANNDILLHPDTIDHLVEDMDKNPDWGICSAVNEKGWCDANGGPTAIFTKVIEEPGSNSEHPDFSFFMLRLEALDRLKAKEEPEGKEPNPGLFDEEFSRRGKAFFEDNDMHDRMHQAGIPCRCITRAPYYHYASQTASSGQAAGLNFEANRAYFIQKKGKTVEEIGL